MTSNSYQSDRNYVQKQSDVLLVTRGRKVSTALFLVSDLIDSKDPLYHAIRTEAVTLTQGLFIHKNMSISERKNSLMLGIISVESIFSLLDLGVGSGVLSDMNFKVLQEEVSYLYTYLVGQLRSLEAGSMSSESIDKAVGDLFGKNTTTGLDLESEKNEEREIERVIGSELDLVNPIETTREKVVVETPYGPSAQRQEKILKLLASHGEGVSISDLAESFPGISKKTIQRELGSLVDDGQVIKHGSRRWVTYVLA